MAGIFDKPDPYRSLIGGASNALGLGSPPSGNGLSGFMGRPASSLLGLVEESVRRRGAWNERFTHWEKSESTTETQRIERARDMVEDALAGNQWLNSQGVRLVQQGSFTNRTNTRGESDIDLRVQHPSIRIEYGYGVDPGAAWIAGDYVNTGVSFADLAGRMRREIVGDLNRQFGAANVDATGNKAITVSSNQGTRAEVDVVPAFTLDYIIAGTVVTGGMRKIQGVAILGKDGSWTLNYPDQHIANGRTKRSNTGHQFKRIVRIVKRMQADMLEHSMISERVPSFLIECLVYMVEDHYFTVGADDRYDRVRRVLGRILERLNSPGLMASYTFTEINGIKPLFGAGQSWTMEKAKAFIGAAIRHLGDA